MHGVRHGRIVKTQPRKQPTCCASSSRLKLLHRVKSLEIGESRPLRQGRGQSGQQVGGGKQIQFCPESLSELGCLLWIVYFLVHDVLFRKHRWNPDCELLEKQKPTFRFRRWVGLTFFSLCNQNTTSPGLPRYATNEGLSAMDHAWRFAKPIM